MKAGGNCIPSKPDLKLSRSVAGVSSSASSFKYLACMLSGPVAL